MTIPTYEELLEREELYRLVIENILDPVFITDNKGNFTFICANVSQILGYSLAEMEAAGNIFAYLDESSFNPGDFDKTTSLKNIETVLAHKNGQKKDYLLTVKKVSIKGGSILYVFHDVTELNRVAKQFQTIFNYASIAKALVDLEGNFTNVNDAVTEMLGYSKNEMLTLNFKDITHPDDLEYSFSNYKKLLNGEVEKCRLEKRYIHKNGSILWGKLDIRMMRDEEGIPLYSIAQLQDITKRKQTEKKLLESENRFKTFFNSFFNLP